MTVRNREIALNVEGLKVHYPAGARHFGFQERKILKAVDGVNLILFKEETLGLVGESGCGKSSLGKAIIRLVEPTAGKVTLGEMDFSALKGERLRRARPLIQMIFQDPYASLDPRMTVFSILAEPLRAHFHLSRLEMSARVQHALERVYISQRALKKYPHEFSGGQRQRIAIARALVLEPKILIADESVSSLDVSIQAEILNLLLEIKSEMGLSMLFIAHNLGVVKYISDRIAVMYLGKIVEMADKDRLYVNPLHPYTKILLSSVPLPDPKKERLRAHPMLTGELPSPLNPPPGCSFHTRCPIASELCRQKAPQLKPVPEFSHEVRCFAVETGVKAIS